MSQAKTLTPAEVDQMLAYIAQHSYALRNRVMLLTGLCDLAPEKWSS